ncbi:MAG: hypothetical protein KAU49_00415, partial [Candidatus Krumholzibacteria bacterium]|nr:hypothetical protein [Candidatus Krumholzibacteria bacterium]
MSRYLLMILFILVAVSIGAAYAGESPVTGLSQAETDTMAAEASPWDWGFRFRLRETYIVDPFDLNSDHFDDRHLFRFRT